MTLVIGHIFLGYRQQIAKRTYMASDIKCMLDHLVITKIFSSKSNGKYINIAIITTSLISLNHISQTKN